MKCFFKKADKNLAILTPLTEKPLRLQSLFNSEYCKSFKRTYVKEHLRMSASENVVMKVRKIKNY